MAKKADFTEQEWDALHKGVTGAGLLVSLSDRSFFDTFKEAGALSKHVAKAKQTGSSELVRELAGVHGTGFGVTTSPDVVERETLEALVREHMGGAYPLDVPLEVSVGYGRSWDAAAH